MPKLMAALTRRDAKGVSKLCGLYSSKAKAVTAASGMMMHLDWMGKAGEWSVDDRPGEVVYSRPDGESFTIDFWEVDRALINGGWTVLK